jgi:hypothetical protein
MAFKSGLKAKKHNTNARDSSGYNLDNADSVVTGQFKITPTVTLHKILKIRNIEWQLGYENR